MSSDNIFKRTGVYKNLVINFSSAFKLADFTDEILPARYFGQHLNKVTNNKLTIFSAMKTITYSIGYFFKLLFINTFYSKQIKVKGEKTSVLIFVPNSKYERFAATFTNRLPQNQTYLILSNTELFNYSFVNIKRIHFSTTFLFLTYYYFIKYLIILLIKNKSEFAKLINNIVQVNKLISTSLYLDELFNCNNFNHYFSLAPAIDQHQIIEKLYNNFFDDTFAIRPDNSNYTDSHKVIVTNNLFYKTEYERKIYEFYKLNASINFLKGAALFIPEQPVVCESEKFNIVFIDTCKTNDEARNNSHIEFLKDFYEESIRRNTIIYHKLHPTRPKEIVKFLNPLIQKGVCKLIDNNQFEKLLKTNTIFISFNSTLLYDIILQSKPVLLVSKYYGTDRFDENEFKNAPIRRILSKENITNVFTLIENKEQNKTLLHDSSILYKWFYEEYNLESGVDSMISLMKVNK